MARMEELRKTGFIEASSKFILGSKRIQGFSLDGLTDQGVYGSYYCLHKTHVTLHGVVHSTGGPLAGPFFEIIFTLLGIQQKKSYTVLSRSLCRKRQENMPRNIKRAIVLPTPPRQALCTPFGRGNGPSGRTRGTGAHQGWWLSSLVDWLKEHGLSITMEGAKRYSLVIPPEADPLEVADHQGIISLTCEDPTSTEDLPIRIGQCWSLPWLDEELETTSVYEIPSFNEVTDYVSLLRWKAFSDSGQQGHGVPIYGERISLRDNHHA